LTAVALVASDEIPDALAPKPPVNAGRFCSNEWHWGYESHSRHVKMQPEWVVQWNGTLVRFIRLFEKLSIKGRCEMTTFQAICFGAMLAWTPTLIVLALLLREAPLDEMQRDPS
jgi:hypothetical protein